MNSLALYITSVFVSFCAVFLKGFQHKNVIGMHYRLTFVTSFVMACFDVATVSLIVKGGWPIAFSSSIGASIGMVAAMWSHSRLVKPKPVCNQLHGDGNA